MLNYQSVTYNDLTTTEPWESLVFIRKSSPFMAFRFRFTQIFNMYYCKMYSTQFHVHGHLVVWMEEYKLLRISTSHLLNPMFIGCNC